MIINALTKYYEILAEDEESDIPLCGYSSAKVDFALNISLTGELLDVIPLKVEGNGGKKLVSRLMIVPEQVIRAAGVSSNFMCDNCTYVLGIDNKGKPERSKEAFGAFYELHHIVLRNAKGQVAKAILAFLENWDVEQARENAALSDCFDEIIKGGNLIFKIDEKKEFAHNDLEIKTLWENHNAKSEDDITGQCLITGKNGTIARLHPKIKNVRNAQSSGASIVSFNAPAYESYGKTQSFNSPVGKHAAFAYTTVLNYMLANPKQKLQVGDTTTVFWAESPEAIYRDLAAELFNPTIPEKETNNAFRRDGKTEKLVQDVLYRAKSGIQISDLNGAIDPQTKFYVLGLSPNASRISIRFFHADSFGEFVKKASQHYMDMEIVKDFEKSPSNIPIWMMLAETVSPNSNDKSASPLLAGAMMRSLLNGGMYPQFCYNAIMQRVLTDIDKRVNYVRASIIKAYLTRKARVTNNQELKEVLSVGLNEETTNNAYLLGRLFAILEKTQQDAGNETIRARYFASACTTPGAVFPILLRLAQFHIAKAKYGFLNDKKIEAVLNNVDGFPSHLTLDQQGLFSLGYYHQKTKLWEKQTKEEQNIEEEN